MQHDALIIQVIESVIQNYFLQLNIYKKKPFAAYTIPIRHRHDPGQILCLKSEPICQGYFLILAASLILKWSFRHKPFLYYSWFHPYLPCFKMLGWRKKMSKTSGPEIIWFIGREVGGGGEGRYSVCERAFISSLNTLSSLMQILVDRVA